jgi:putative flippase GtrA
MSFALPCYYLFMPSLLRQSSVKTHASQMTKFIVCGGMGFLLDMLSLGFFVESLGIQKEYAGILSSCVGAAFVFVANKFFTFRNREKSYGSQVFKFAMVYGVSIAMNALIYNLFLWFGLYYLVAKIIAVGIGAMWNYALSHGFIFKKSEDIDIAIV